MSLMEEGKLETTPRALTQEQDERLYSQGLHDYVVGRRDTEAARHYVAYWAERNQAQIDVGQIVVQALAE